MAFNRLDESRSSFQGFEKRGRSFFRGESPLSSPLFSRKKQLANGGFSGPSSVASSRESSLDRSVMFVNAGGVDISPTEVDQVVAAYEASRGGHASLRNVESAPYGGLHNVVSRVCSSPKMTLKQRFQVMRSGSFSDVAGAKSTLEAKRKRWLNRSGSLRLNKGQKGPSNLEGASQLEISINSSNYASPLSSPETERRGSLPIRDRSLDRVMMLERRGSYQPYCNGGVDDDSGKMSQTVKTVGFVNR
jgi:hypothetical protein